MESNNARNFVPGTGYYEVTKDYKLIRCNAQIRSYVPHAKAGDCCYEVLFGRTEPCAACPILRNNETFQRYHYDKEGDKWIESCFSPIDDDSYAVITRESLEEYTDRRITTRKQRISNIEKMPGCFFVMKPERGYPYEYISDRFVEMTGWDREEIRHEFKNCFANMLDPQSAKKCWEYDPSVLIGKGENFNELIRQIRTKAGYKWMSLSVVFVDMGKESYLQGTMHDVTDYIEMEKQFNNLQRDSQSIIRGLCSEYHSIWLIETDTPEHKMTLYNTMIGVALPAQVQMKIASAGYDKAHLNYIDTYIAEEDRERVKSLISWDIIDEKAQADSVYRVDFLRDVDGVKKTHQLVFTSVDFKGSRLVVMAVRDIDEQLREEKEKQKSIETALDSAKKSNDAKTAFLSSVSHDIRTPMNIIMGYSKLARKTGGLSKEADDYLAKIYDASEYLNLLVNDVLDMAEIESGKFNLKPKPSVFPDIVRRAYDMLKNKAEAGQLEYIFNCNLDKQEPEVMCDPVKTEQLIQNLLSNAVKYTQAGGRVRVFVKHEYLGKNRDKIGYFVQIEDTGRGMSEEFKKHLFEPYSREITGDENIVGTGLGMAIVNNLVQMMNGSISVESQLGVGTKFTLRLAFERVEKTDDNGERANKSTRVNSFRGELKKKLGDEFADDESKQSGSLKRVSRAIRKAARKNNEVTADSSSKLLAGKRILVVDDNEMNREIEFNAVSAAGASVVEAVNGKDCIIKYEADEEGFDLILMDIQMPVMNGYDAAKYIRSLKDEKKAKVPMIAFSAFAYDKDVNAAFRAGMNAHLSKPVDIDVMISKIVEIINS